MDFRIICPICGRTDINSLSEHLKAHSKQSLIDMLLQQQQQQHSISAASSRGDSEDELAECSNRQNSNEGLKTSNVSTSTIQSITSLEPMRSLIKPDPSNVAFEVEISNFQEQVEQYGLLPVCTISMPILGRDHESNIEETDTSTPRQKSSFVLVQKRDTSQKPGSSSSTVQSAEIPLEAESTITGPQTSLIKYIIDEVQVQSGDPLCQHLSDPERWILPDGREISVFSSFTETSSKPNEPTEVSAFMTSERMDENASLSADKQSTHILDLMTDEEIPPQGEISEFEESNTSSFLSEDSNVKALGGLFSDSRRLSPVVDSDGGSVPTKRKKTKKGSSSGTSKHSIPHQYLCYECFEVQKFNSLFELIQHKLDEHKMKATGSEGESSNIAAASTSYVSHILPEEFRAEISDTNQIIDLKAHESFEVVSKKAQKKQYFCVYCNFLSKTKTALTKHMETIHPDRPAKPNVFECTDCGKTFRARTNLRKHLLVHKERTHICTTCNKKFTSNFKLMEHTRVHTKNYPFKCKVCEKSYRTISLLNTHVKTNHTPLSERPVKKKLEFYCGVCHRVLHSRRSLVYHTQLHLAKPKKCNFCPETFIRHSVLVRHIRIAHDPQFESKESKDCPVCHKKLHPNSIKKHMRIHDDQKPFPCRVCGKSFRTYANLASHAWSHTNCDKPFKCRSCPKSYLFKRNLDTHMMVHKRRTLHFSCNECGVRFTHKVNMKRHLEEHFTEKKYKCKTCGKCFHRNYYLMEHERTHSGLKPYTCTICGKASSTKSNHRAHIKIHDARESGSQEG